jgi:hypothetical protein
MIIVFNILICALLLLIAYWWSNQGLFSAILHLLCVIAAGAVTLAFWEPLVTGVLLRGNPFDNYVWGISFIGLFAVTLFLLRLATNKLIPANVDVPHWANLGFGFPVGAAAAVLTLGMTIIGLGFIQSHREILGFVGWGRSERTGRPENTGGMWLPVHEWTDEFYGWLSVTSLRTRQPLRHYYPALYAQSSLVRDSYANGRGQLSLQPSEAEITTVAYCPERRQCAVGVKFYSGAVDFGQRLTLSASQLRLITQPPSKTGTPRISFPMRWRQEVQGEGPQILQFDGFWNFITSVPGREAAEILLEFQLPSQLEPRFIQIRGTRFPLQLRDADVVSGGDYDALWAGAAMPAARNDAPAPTPASAGVISSNDLKLTNRVPVRISTNMLRGTIEHIDRYLSKGEALLKKGGTRPARNLMVRGVYEPDGTRVAQLNVSRGTSADIFGSVREQVNNDARMFVTDSVGNTYTPIGYMHQRADGVLIKLEPSRRISTIGELPSLPASGSQTLTLLFRVTEGVTIVRFDVGPVTVGTCDLEVAMR